jgi:hypothetical protein
MSEKVVETEYDDLAQELGGAIVVIRDQDKPTREMPTLVVPAAAVARLAAELQEYHDNANALIAEHSAALEAGLKTKDWLTEEGQKMQAKHDALAERVKELENSETYKLAGAVTAQAIQGNERLERTNAKLREALERARLHLALPHPEVELEERNEILSLLSAALEVE